MPAIPRKTQLVFGSSLVPAGNVAKFGSLAQGAAAYSNDPALIQTAQWLFGFNGALIGNRSPAQEDMNAMMLVVTQQLAYLLQSGIAEWDSNTTYFKWQLCRIPGTPFIASSRSDNNLNNNPATDSNNWNTAALSCPVVASSVGTQTIPVDASYHAIAFASKQVDAYGSFDTSTSRFTAPVMGVYEASVSLQCDANGNPLGSTEMTLVVFNITTNSVVKGSTYSVANPVGNRWEPALVKTFPLNAGDVIEIRLEANASPNTGSLNVSNSDLSICRKV